MAIKYRHHDNRIELLQGTLDMLILQTLQWGPQHGLGISQMIRRKSEDLVQIEAGSLYPALHRLEQQGWLSAEWDVSEKNQRAKYYKLTRKGKKQLAAEQSKWELLLKAMRLVMQPDDKG
jgi:PadR family transcriptional regulator, regulatory protein PadR